MFHASPAVMTAVSGGLAHLGRRPLVLLTLACLLGIIWADWAAPPLVALGVLCLLVIALAAFALHRDLTAINLLLLLGMLLSGALLHTWRITPGPDDLRPQGFRNLPLAQGTVARVYQQSEDRQDLLLEDVRVEGVRVARLAAVRLPAHPRVQLAQQVTLGEVSLWRLARRSGGWERSRMREGVHAGGEAKRLVQVAQRPSAVRSVHAAATASRRRMLDTLTGAMPGPNADFYARLLAGMVYGMQAAPISDDLKELFRRTGTIHLLVVSGAQVSLIAFALIFLVRGTRLVLPVWGMALVAIALLGVAVVAGMGASVERSVAMALMLLASFAAGRRYDFPTSLALSALVLCLLDSSIVFDLGAQLTYACCLGVYLAAPTLEPGTRRQPWHALSFVCWATFGAWLFASPLLISTFHRLVLLAGLANLVAVPLSVVLLYVGLAAIALGMIWLPLAVPLCWLARVLLETLLRVNTFCDTLPLAGVDQLHLGYGALIVWYLVVIAALWALRSKTPWQLASEVDRRKLAVGAGSAACLALIFLCFSPRSTDTLRLQVLSVGAGQCVLAQLPGGGNILLDAGMETSGGARGPEASREVLPFLALKRVRSLQAIVLSHPHEDHCNLAAQIMQAVPTGTLIIGPEGGAEASWPGTLQVARQRGVQIIPAKAGGSLQLAPQCQLDFLEPTSLLAATDEDTNNNSLVSRLVYRQVRVLLPADLQAEGERRMLHDYRHDPEALRAEVLLAPHHASVYSGTPEFLRAVAPEVVLISCGRGTRQPRPAALRVFEDLGLTVWRTDLSGTISLSTDGRTVTVRGSGH
ncbi:MAG: ComEC/Rec2 family competence protein [Armatimonadota bacterium]